MSKLIKSFEEKHKLKLAAKSVDLIKKTRRTEQVLNDLEDLLDDDKKRITLKDVKGVVENLKKSPKKSARKSTKRSPRKSAKRSPRKSAKRSPTLSKSPGRVRAKVTKKTFKNNEIKRIAKNSGVKRVSNDVYDKIREIQEDKIADVVYLLQIMLENSGRKTVTVEDVSYVIEHLENKGIGGTFKSKRCI